MRDLALTALLALALWGVIGCVTSAQRVEDEASAEPPTLLLRPVPIAEGFTSPVGIAHSGMPADERIFVLEQDGAIWIVRAGGTVSKRPFLDLRDQVHVENWEQGLLGMAFHPQYPDNGYFYVNYTGVHSNTHIVRFQVDPADPDRALPESEFPILTLEQPEPDHNGGGLAFGPDGYLYAALGDGGSHHSFFNAQDKASYFGKILRLDVDRGRPYAIPPDNPFVDDSSALDEIWAMGVRNPWRISFDRASGDLFIGDVGVSSWEEVNWQPATSSGGENYGWPCYEGETPFFLEQCEEAPFQSPIHAYSHEGRCSVIGGYVYRGKRFPELVGHYLFADLCSGELRSLVREGERRRVAAFGQYDAMWTSFGEDADGELYLVAHNDSRLFRLDVEVIVLDEPLFLPLVR